MSGYAPDTATARIDLCRFLSACYYEPDESFQQEGLFDSILTAATRLGPHWAPGAQRLRTAFLQHDLQELLVDHARLFLGPMKPLAPPYGSAWLPIPALSETEEAPPPAVLAMYSAGGFDMDEGFRELPDHIAVELEFLYLLTFNAALATATGNPEGAEHAASLRGRFLREHLGAWVGPFAQAVLGHAQTPFYRELAVFTEQFVQQGCLCESTH